jgi:hypothetical protein
MKRPQFSLRDLIWLVLLCSVAGGWYVDRTRRSKELDSVLELGLQESIARNDRESVVDNYRKSVGLTPLYGDGPSPTEAWYRRIFDRQR